MTTQTAAHSTDYHFKKSSEQIENLIRDGLMLPQANLLKIYGLFKQATVGDCNVPSPSMLQMKAKAKWSAWNENRGMDQKTAKMQYIKTAIALDLYNL